MTARVAAVVAKLTGRGGQSEAYFIQYALKLGTVITITEHAPARCGHPSSPVAARCGDRAYGTPWIFAWTVHSQLGAITTAVAGSSHAGDPLRSWANTRLECQIREIAPAHDIVLFEYYSLHYRLDDNFMLDSSPMDT